MSLKRIDLLTVGHIPQAHTAVVSTREGTTAVGRESHTQNPSFMFILKAAQLAQLLQVPETNRVIVAGGERLPSIRRESHAPDRLRVPFQKYRLFGVVHVPEANQAVLTP